MKSYYRFSVLYFSPTRCISFSPSGRMFFTWLPSCHSPLILFLSNWPLLNLFYWFLSLSPTLDTRSTRNHTYDDSKIIFLSFEVRTFICHCLFDIASWVPKGILIINIFKATLFISFFKPTLFLNLFIWVNISSILSIAQVKIIGVIFDYFLPLMPHFPFISNIYILTFNLAPFPPLLLPSSLMIL